MLCGVWADCKTDPVVCKKNKQRVRVVIKMFFVMGVSWIAEIISFFVYWFFGDDKKHILCYSLTPFQLFNSLQVCILLHLALKLSFSRTLVILRVLQTLKWQTYKVKMSQF